MTTFNIDSSSKYSHMSEDHILQMCGILPIWVLNETDDSLSIKEIFEKEYQFGVYEMTGGEVDINSGAYSYPEDPVLYPLLEIERGDEKMYQYEYGIVSIVNSETGDTFVARLD